MEISDLLRTIALYFDTAVLIALGLALLLVWFVFRQVRKIHVPAGADFVVTLQHTPFVVVLLIDLLDFALDFLSAPIAWVILDRLGLRALRGVSVVSAAVPFTQPIPLMTLSWLVARFVLRQADGQAGS